MTPEAIAEYRRIANTEQDLSRAFVAAIAIHKLCTEVEQLQAEVTRLGAVADEWIEKARLYHNALVAEREGAVIEALGEIKAR
jgi:hypothetical protein